MSDSDLQIAIRVDASAARQGADEAKAAIGGIGPQIEALGKTFGELGKSLKGGLEGLGQIGKAIAGVGKEGGSQLQSVTLSLKSVSEAAAGLGRAAPGFRTLSHSASEMSVSLSGGKLSGVSTSFKSLGEAIAGVGRSAPAGLKATSAAASDLSVKLGSAAGEGASKFALLGEAAGGVAGVALAIGQVAVMAASATAEWAEATSKDAGASADARQNAANLCNAIGNADGAFKDVGDTLANAFAPVLAGVVVALTDLAKGFKDSYDKGGAAKTIVDILIGAFKLLASGVEIAIGVIIGVVEAVRGQIQQWKDQFDIAKTLIAGGVDNLKVEFQTLGRILRDVLSGDFGKAVGDFKAGLGQIEQQTRQTVANVQQELAKLQADKLAEATALAGVGHATHAAVAGNYGGAVRVQPDRAARPQGSQAGGHAASGSGASGGGAGCDCDPDAAIACEHQAQIGRTAAAEVGAQDRSHADAAANLAIAQSDSDLDAAFARGLHGQVEVAKAADTAKVDSNQSANRRITEANDKTLKQFESSMKGLVNSFASGLARMAEGAETLGKVIRTIGQKILDDVIRVVIDMVEKWAWGVTEQVLATQKGQALLNALGLRELAAAILRDQQKTAAAIAGENAKNVAKKAGAAQGLAIDGATALKSVVNDAAQAASGAYQGVLKVIPAPFGIPVAAGAAAAAFAAVMAFRGLISAAGGYDIPAGTNPLTQLHAQEMVLPARLANPMRDMLASFGSGASPMAAGHSFSFGDTHIHGAPNMSPADFRQALAEHRASVAEAVASALHGGWRPSYRQPVGAL